MSEDKKYQMSYVKGPINITVRIDDIEELVGDVAYLLKKARENKEIVKALSQKNGNKQEALPVDQKCPECGEPMVRRTGKSGKDFYGCSKYPECKGITWIK